MHFAIAIAHATCNLQPKVKLQFFVANGRHPNGAKKLAQTVRKVDVRSNRNNIIIAQDDSCRYTTKTGSFFVWSIEKLLYVKHSFDRVT